LILTGPYMKDDSPATLEDLVGFYNRGGVPSPSDALPLQLHAVNQFAARCADQYTALAECLAFVKLAPSRQGQGAVSAIAFYKRPAQV